MFGRLGWMIIEGRPTIKGRPTTKRVVRGHALHVKAKMCPYKLLWVFVGAKSFYLIQVGYRLLECVHL